MPSIGAVTTLIVARRMDETIKATFDENTRQDAYKFLNLSSRSGDITYIVVAAVFGPFLTIAALFATSINGLVAATVTGMIFLLALYWAVWQRKKARKELNALVASNREHWLPIADKLEQIILNAGKFQNGLPPSQVTRIVN